MQHLEAERIAAFDHEAPSVEELAHLTACTTCRTERNAFSALNQRSMHMADAPVYPPAPRLTNWESLSQRLRSEGLMAGEAQVARVSDADAGSNELRFESVMRALNTRTPSSERTHSTTKPIAMESWWQRAKPRTNSEFFRAVAAVLLFTITGAGVNQIRNDRLGSASGSMNESTATASLNPLDLGNTGFSSVEQATKALANTERDFDRISTWLTANDPSANKSDILRKRLAALDRITAAAYQEWQTSPQDRVLDHHFRSAYAARELTLKQLGGALPVGRSLERF